LAYKKVFTASRFQTKSPNALSIDQRDKSVRIGAREASSHKDILLGKVIEQGKTSNILDYEVRCDIAFPHVVGIFGSRGSGKSFDLGVFLEGIFIRDDDVNDAAIVFDVQDQFWTLSYSPSSAVPGDEPQLSEISRWGLTAAHVPDLRVFVPRGSDTQVPSAQEFALSAAQLSVADWLAILELERFSPMGQALLTLLNAAGSIEPMLLARQCSSGLLAASFQQGTIDGLRWRLESLQAAQIIGTSGISVDALLVPGHLTVILMRNLSESVRGLVVGVIARLVADRMGRIQQARKVALRTAGGQHLENENAITNRVWIVLDEAHVLAPSDGSTAASVPLIDYVKRGRDAGLSLIFATQQPSAVDSRLMSQVDLSITHMLGFEADLSAATARMPTRSNVDYEVENQKVGSVSDVIRSLGPGEAVIADGMSGRIFLAKIRPRTTAHGGATPK
jgi:uncharacterized protein